MDIKLLHTTTTLSGNAVVINSVFTAEYSLYGFIFSGAKGDGGQFTMRFHESGTPATGASDYSRFRRVGTNSTEWVDDHETGTDAMRLDLTDRYLKNLGSVNNGAEVLLPVNLSSYDEVTSSLGLNKKG